MVILPMENTECNYQMAEHKSLSIQLTGNTDIMLRFVFLFIVMKNKKKQEKIISLFWSVIKKYLI